MLNVFDSVTPLSKDEAHLELAFSVDEKGGVMLSNALHLELPKPENSDLLDWHQANLIELFK